MEWWLVWTIVAVVVLLSVVLVAVPAMALRRRLAELDRVKALVRERMLAKRQKLLAGSERVQATLGGVQYRTEAMQGKLAALKAARAGGTAVEAPPAPAAVGMGADRAGSGGVAS